MEFDSLLLHISDQLDNSQLQDLKFLCRDVIGKRDLERVDRGTKLFQLLSERNHLSPDHTELLARHLDSIQRPDLSKKLQDFDCQTTLEEQREDCEEKRNLDMAIEVVEESLGRTWRKLGRKLGLTEAKLDSISVRHPNDLEETAREMLKEWRKSRGAEHKTSELIKALRACELNMTADIIMEKLAAAGVSQA